MSLEQPAVVRVSGLALAWREGRTSTCVILMVVVWVLWAMVGAAVAGPAGRPARVAPDVSTRVAAGATADVILRGTPDEIAALVARHGLSVKRALRSGAVVSLDGAGAAVAVERSRDRRPGGRSRRVSDDGRDGGIDGCVAGVGGAGGCGAADGPRDWHCGHRLGDDRARRPAGPYRGARRFHRAARVRARFLRPRDTHRGHHRGQRPAGIPGDGAGRASHQPAGPAARRQRPVERRRRSDRLGDRASAPVQPAGAECVAGAPGDRGGGGRSAGAGGRAGGRGGHRGGLFGGEPRQGSADRASDRRGDQFAGQCAGRDHGRRLEHEGDGGAVRRRGDQLQFARSDVSAMGW